MSLYVTFTFACDIKDAILVDFSEISTHTPDKDSSFGLGNSKCTEMVCVAKDGFRVTYMF